MWIIFTFLLIFLLITVIIFFSFYIKQLINSLIYIYENNKRMIDYLDEYREHVEIVSKMETYYGDHIIENLLRHTIEVVKILKENNMNDIFEEEEKGIDQTETERQE